MCTSGYVMATLPLVFTHALACPGVLGVFTKSACSCLQVYTCLPACFCDTLHNTSTFSDSALRSFSMWSAEGHQLPRIFL